MGFLEFNLWPKDSVVNEKYSGQVSIFGYRIHDFCEVIETVQVLALLWDGSLAFREKRFASFEVFIAEKNELYQGIASPRKI